MLKLGDRVGRLTLLKEKREKRGNSYRKYFYCHCDCGTEKWIRVDSLSSGKIQSCGCYNKENNFYKPVSIAGKRYGRLEAIEPTGKKKNGSIVWKCKCDCGNMVEIAQQVLERGDATSCGCFRRELNRVTAKERFAQYIKENFADRTNVTAIKRTTPLKNSSTGIRGVSYDSKRAKYIAQIEFKGKHYNLGRFNTREEAKAAYEEAKEELHNKFLKEHEASK